MATSNRHYRPPSKDAGTKELFAAATTVETPLVEPTVVAEAPVVPELVTPDPTPTAVAVSDVPFGNKKLDLTPYEPPVVSTEAETTAATVPDTPVLAGVTDDGSPVDPDYIAWKAERDARAGFDSLTTVDPEVAAELHRAVVQPAIRAATEELTRVHKKQLDDARAEYAAGLNGVTDRVTSAQERQDAILRDTVNAKIFAVHPDAQKILNSKAFVEAMSKTQPYETTTHWQKLQQAYYAHDGDFVANTLKEYLQGQPDIDSIAEVGQAMVATHPAISGEEEVMSEAEYGRRRTEFYRSKRTSESLAEWDAYQRKYQTALAEGRVK
jgi:hypothetical protein